MSKIISIRNVPDKVHRILKKRAKTARMSMTAYVLKELEKMVERPTLEELQERLRSREPVTLPISSAEIIREMRGPIGPEATEVTSAARTSAQRSRSKRERV